MRIVGETHYRVVGALMMTAYALHASHRDRYDAAFDDCASTQCRINRAILEQESAEQDAAMRTSAVTLRRSLSP